MGSIYALSYGQPILVRFSAQCIQRTRLCVSWTLVLFFTSLSPSLPSLPFSFLYFFLPSLLFCPLRSLFSSFSLICLTQNHYLLWLCFSSFIDPVVLASPPLFWPGWQGTIPPVCHWHIQGALTGLHCFGGDEWHSEVPNSQRRPINRSTSLCPHLVRLQAKHTLIMLY